MVKQRTSILKTVVNTFTNLWGATRVRGNYLYSIPYDAWNREDYLKSFLDIPELNAVICTDARMFANGILKEVDANGTEVKNSKLVAVLNNPNWFQSGEEFRRQSRLFRLIFGNEYIYEMVPFGIDLENANARALYTLPPNWMEIKYTETQPFFMFTETPEGLKYTIQYRGKEYPIPSANLIHLNDDRVRMTSKYGENGGNIFKGESKLKALTPATNNLKMAYETRGTLLKNRGALGMLSGGAVDKLGAVPLQPDEQERIQNEYAAKYGGLHGQSQLLITNATLTWQQMSVNPDKMGLYTETAEDFNKIIDAYGSRRELYAGKDATYENAKAAEKGVYMDTIIPAGAEWVAGINKKYRAGAKTKLIIDYTHLPIFQEDLGKRGESLKSNIDALSLALADQAITIDMYKTELEKFGIKQQNIK